MLNTLAPAQFSSVRVNSTQIRLRRNSTSEKVVNTGEGIGWDTPINDHHHPDQADQECYEAPEPEMLVTASPDQSTRGDESYLPQTLDPVVVQEKEDFRRMFAVVNAALRGMSYKIDLQLYRLQTDLQTPTTEAPHKEWAKISLALESLEKLSAEVIRARETPRTNHINKDHWAIQIQGMNATNGNLKLSFIQQNLSALLAISNQRWAEHAKTVIVNNLLDHYSQKYDAAYEKSKSAKISAESNFLPVSVGASLHHTDTEATDMEGNLYRKKMNTVGATVGGEVGINFLKTMGVSVFNTKGGISGGVGELEEYAKIKKMVLDTFEKLIEEHAGDTALIPFTCRYSALGQTERPAHDQITIHNIARIRRHYQSDYQRMNRHFELLQKKLLHDFAPDLEDDSPLPLLKPAELEDCSPLQATIVSLDGEAAASLGPKIEAMGYQLAGINASGAVSLNRSTVSFARQTPVIEKLMTLASPVDTSLRSDARKNLIKQKKQIMSEVTRKSAQFLSLLKQDYHRYLRAMNTPPQHGFLNRLWDFLHFLQSVFSKTPEIVAAKWGGNRKSLPGLHDKVPGSSLSGDLANWKYNFTQLKNEFEFYSTLQSQLIQGAKGAEQSIQNFHTYYHANSPEDCLYHMQLLNMNAAVELFKLESAYGRLSQTQRAAITALKETVLQFEKVLNKPDFDIDQTKLEALTSVKDDVTVVSTSLKHSASVEVGLLPTDTQSLFRAKGAGSIEFSHKLISVPLRRGWFRDYQYSCGWLAQLGSADAVTEFFSARLGENSLGLEDLPGLREEVTKHFSASVGVGRDVTYTRRMFTPDLFPGIGATWLYTIGSNTKKSMTSLKVPVPLVTAGLERVKSSSSLKILECSPLTTLYFLLLYHHDYSVDKNLVYDKDGKVGDQSNWKGIKQTQRNALEELFCNVAARDDDNAGAKKLNKELTVIHQTILNSLSDNPKYRHNTEEEAAALDQAQQAFFSASAAFKTATKLLNSRERDYRYDKALDCFQRLMFAYCPHLNRIKVNSDIAVPRKLTLETVA